MMTAEELVSRLKSVASAYKTLYVMGCFGAPMTAANKERYIQHHEYNQRPGPKAAILAASADTFGFDCVCLIKGLLWGWSGNKNAIYGGATYATNGVPDVNADTMINLCSGVSSNWADIIPGEMLWKSGHAGIYIGNGQAVECTPSWDNRVQITNVANIVGNTGAKYRTWTKHGRLPWVNYQQMPFVDVKPSNWFYDAVRTVYNAGIMVGTDDTHFSPNSTLTRAQVAQIIANLIERYHS